MNKTLITLSTLLIILIILLILCLSLFITSCIKTHSSSTDDRLESTSNQLEDDEDSVLSQLDELNNGINKVTEKHLEV